MTEELDFERQWLGKFASRLEETSGEEIRDEIMRGSESLTSQSDRSEVIEWSRAAMEKLDTRVAAELRTEIMTSCACQYPTADLVDARERYEETRDVDVAIRTLRERFEAFLNDTIELPREMIDEVLAKGWGPAGVRQGSSIIATKIPKSGKLREYLEESDPEKRRRLYCHCQRIRSVLESSESISATYCYCGAGFYKGIWEEILREPVEVEVLDSVLKGDEVCRVAVHLPSGIQKRE